jgi:uncharacterized membrane protein
MSKADFFIQLQERLRGLPYEEQLNILRVYEDLFRQAEAGGKSEKEIIESLGFTPVPMPAQASYERPPVYRKPSSGLRATIAAVSLVMFNLIFILGPFIAIAATLFSLSLTAVLFTFSSVWVIIGTGIPDTMNILLLEIFTTLTLTGLGVLLGIGMWKLNYWFIALVKRYLALNLRLVRGE